MSPSRLAPLLALALATAGCIGLVGEEEPVDPAAATNASSFTGPVDTERLSQPVYGLDQVVETFLPSHDDVELHSVAYHPNVSADTKTPVVIRLSPYMGNLAPEAQAQQNSYWTQLLVQRGYTVVHASVRGTGYSGGCFQLGGPDEIRDAHELVKHYHEAEWSNGNVSLIGISYPGTTPWQAAITDPPGLRTVVPMEGISDMYRYDHINGASYTHGPAFPTYYTALVDWTLVPQNAEGPEYVLPPLDAFCPGAAERISQGYRTAVDGVHDAFWDVRNYEDRVQDIDVPVFLVHGFQDFNVDPDNGIPIFDELPDDSKAWLGQWAHNIPFDNTYNSDWDRHDWNMTIVAWFDRWLKGEDNGITDRPPVLAQDDHGHWFRTQTWPPSDRTNATFYLTGDGRLTPQEPGSSSVLQMAKDPTNAVDELPTSADEARGRESLTFTSTPMPEDTLISGQPRLELELAIDRSDGHLVADLYDADAENGSRWLGHAILNLAQRESRSQEDPMPPDRFVPVNMTFVPMNAFVPEDHRLELVLRPEAPGWIHPAPENPTYHLRVGGEDPPRLVVFDLDEPGFEPAPEIGDVPWSQ